MTDTLACENSTVTVEVENNNEGEDSFGMSTGEQEGSLTPEIKIMKIQDNQEQGDNCKHEENMLGDLVEGAEERATCKGLFPEGYQMSVTCGGFTKVLTVQDANNTHTLMDPRFSFLG